MGVYEAGQQQALLCLAGHHVNQLKRSHVPTNQCIDRGLPSSRCAKRKARFAPQPRCESQQMSHSPQLNVYLSVSDCWNS